MNKGCFQPAITSPNVRPEDVPLSVTIVVAHGYITMHNITQHYVPYGAVRSSPSWKPSSLQRNQEYPLFWCCISCLEGPNIQYSRFLVSTSINRYASWNQKPQNFGYLDPPGWGWHSRNSSAVEARKLEHDRPPTPTQRNKDDLHKSSYIHLPTFFGRSSIWSRRC